MNKVVIAIVIVAVAGLGFFQLMKERELAGAEDEQGIVAYKSGVNGTVMVGPTCPVVQ